MDRIRWINHAGFELQTEGLRIVCDPWLDGLAFSQSWALLSATRFAPADFDGVNYIWFSHEHPDHFSPATLRSIPQSHRANITILFQRTRDGRVARFCRELGFRKVLELHDWQKVELGRGVSFSLKTVDEDSLCLIQTPERSYLNVNDCVSPNPRSLHESIAAKWGRPDVLFTQFSYANWAGNPGETATMKKSADEKLRQIELQLEIYKPSTLIPFASFVWFCREDNFHLNAGSNKIGDIFRLFSPLIDCVILYPGDLYNVGSTHDSSTALASYEADEGRHLRPLGIKEKAVLPDELDFLSASHLAKVWSENGKWVFWPLVVIGYVKPVTIYLTDISRSLTYSMLEGIRWKDLPRERTDIEFTSKAMAQMLRNGSGYDTLYISGRFIERRPGARFDLSKNFFVSRRNEHGQFFPSTFLSPGFLFKKALHILASLASRRDQNAVELSRQKRPL